MGLFDKIFSKVHTLPCTVDMHSHLLPGIDDGAKDLEDSLNMITGLLDLGYKEFITTPHIMGDYYRNSKDTIFPALDEVRNELVKKNISCKISAAAEYYLDEWFYEKVKKGEEFLTLKDNYLLVETSYINKPANFRAVLFDLQSAGYSVVLAHPERYSYLFSSFDLFEELYELKMNFQININSLSGHYGKESKKFAEQLIKKNMVDFIGTDCHGMRHIEKHQEALKSKYFGQLASLNLKNDSLAS